MLLLLLLFPLGAEPLFITAPKSCSRLVATFNVATMDKHQLINSCLPRVLSSNYFVLDSSSFVDQAYTDQPHNSIT